MVDRVRRDAIRVKTAKRIKPFDDLHKHFRKSRFNIPSDPKPLLADKLVSIEPDSSPLLTPMLGDTQLSHREPVLEETISTTPSQTTPSKTSSNKPLSPKERRKSSQGFVSGLFNVRSHREPSSSSSFKMSLQHVPSSYRFSASGAMLVLWTPGRTVFSSLTVPPLNSNTTVNAPSLDCHNYQGTETRLVCAGTEKIATISDLGFGESGSSGRSTGGRARVRSRYGIICFVRPQRRLTYM